MSAKTKSAPPSRFARIDAQHRCVPAHTALLVVDMQHGFLHVGASLEVPQGRGLVPRIQRLIACCRSVGTRVIFTKFVYSPAVPCLRGEPFGVEHLPPPDSQPTGHGRPSGNCLVGPRAGQGAESADIIPELAPRPDELVVASHGYGNKPWAAQFDRPLAELMGKTNWDLFPKDTALVFEASDQAARLRGEVSNLLESGIAPDGKRHWWKVFKFPLPGPGGRPGSAAWRWMSRTWCWPRRG